MYHFKRLRPGGGHLEGPGDRDAETWERELHAVMDRAYHRAYELGGAASGEHGIGVSKRRYFLRETRRESLTVMNQIKDVLYPPAHSERPKILHWRTRLCRACLSAPPASPTR